MAISQELRNKIKTLFMSSFNIEQKITNHRQKIYKGDYHHFLVNMFSLESILTTKLIHGLYTTFGMSFYEQACKLLAEDAGYQFKTQVPVLGELSDEVELYLSSLKIKNYKPNKMYELECIRSLSKPGNLNEYSDNVVDLYITTPTGKEILIDIKTVKGNSSNFKDFRIRSLRWAAYRFSQNSGIDVEPYFAIPYNPTKLISKDTNYPLMSKYIDRKDILVGDELWRKVSNNNCSIDDLIEIFKEIGEESKEYLNDAIEEILKNLN